MNAHAGVRNGGCGHRECNRCTTYIYYAGGASMPVCTCGHARRWHAQVWRDRPYVTTAGWDAGAA